MKYMGSKNRIAKHILPIMLKEMEDKCYSTWVEPFVGGANMIDKVPSHYRRLGYDINPHTIAALLCIRDSPHLLPDVVTEDFYKEIKGSDPHPVNSLIRYGCSFGGRFDEGYARDRKGIPPRNFAAELKRNSLKQSPALQGVGLVCSSYEDILVTNSLIYCDPPYAGTKWYRSGLVPKLDYEKFFEWCVEMKSKGNSVFISEYDAPFECIWEGNIKTTFSSGRKEATHVATERLFVV